MESQQEIFKIERALIRLLHNDNYPLSKHQLKRSDNLLNRWKELTKYKEPKN